MRRTYPYFVSCRNRTESSPYLVLPRPVENRSYNSQLTGFRQTNEKNRIPGPILWRERLVSEIYLVSTRSYRDNRMLVIILNSSSFRLIMLKSIFLDPIAPESKFSYALFIKSTFNQQFVSPGIHCRRYSLIILMIIHHCTVERHFVNLTLGLIRICIFEESPGSSLCGLSSSSVSLSL